MQVQVLLFATLRDRAGQRQESYQLQPGDRVSQVKAAIIERHPDLEALLDAAVIAVNQEFAQVDTKLQDGDEVAFFPPVSGGQSDDSPTWLAVSTDALDLNEVLARLVTPATGAACVFTGIVRARTERGDPHETERLEYEAYQAMAEAKLAQVADEIRQQWSQVVGIAIIQRLGNLQAGEPTVMVACSAGHRDSGVFEAARYGIDRLKEIVPIWKKEIGPDGASWVEGEYRPGPTDRRPGAHDQ